MFKYEAIVSYHVEIRNKTSTSTFLSEAEAMKPVRFPWSPLEAAPPIFNLSHICYNFFVEELIKKIKYIAFNAASQASQKVCLEKTSSADHDAANKSYRKFHDVTFTMHI
jgi:hypothetical protein